MLRYLAALYALFALAPTIDDEQLRSDAAAAVAYAALLVPPPPAPAPVPGSAPAPAPVAPKAPQLGEVRIAPGGRWIFQRVCRNGVCSFDWVWYADLPAWPRARR
jgi:hypothetical protein